MSATFAVLHCKWPTDTLLGTILLLCLCIVVLQILQSLRHHWSISHYKELMSKGVSCSLYPQADICPILWIFLQREKKENKFISRIFLSWILFPCRKKYLSMSTWAVVLYNAWRIPCLWKANMSGKRILIQPPPKWVSDLLVVDLCEISTAFGKNKSPGWNKKKSILCRWLNSEKGRQK